MMNYAFIFVLFRPILALNIKCTEEMNHSQPEHQAEFWGFFTVV